MEAENPFGRPKRTLRQRLGLQALPPDPDAWVKVASYHLDSDRGSRSAARAVTKLNHAGIEAQQHKYVLPDPGAMHLTGPPSAVDRIRVAVLVHDRDRLRATELLTHNRTDQRGRAHAAQ